MPPYRLPWLGSRTLTLTFHPNPHPNQVSAAGEAYRLPLQLLYACTQREPRQRPSARQVARQLVRSNPHQEGRAMAQAEGLLARPALLQGSFRA